MPSAFSRSPTSWTVSCPYDDGVTVDVLTQIVIDRPRAVVAAYAVDPDNATSWYVNIKSSRVLHPPVELGSLIEFTAQFLGKKLVYTYEVVEYEPGEKFVMRTANGPFPMETTYTFADAGEGKTLMTLRNHGAPSGFSKMVGPAMEIAMRRANNKDLRRLKEILEG